MKAEKFVHKCGGFTLIEVLVAVGVVSVASLAFLPSFSKASKQKALQQNSENVKDALATARNKALTEVRNPGVGSQYLYSGVKFTQDSGTYTMFRSNNIGQALCNTVTAGQKNASYESDTSRTLSNNVIAKLPDGESPTCFFFEYGTGNAYVTKGNVVDGNDVTNACL